MTWRTSNPTPRFPFADASGGDIVRLSLENTQSGRRNYADTGISASLWTQNNDQIARPRRHVNAQSTLPAGTIGKLGEYVGYLEGANEYFETPYTGRNAITSGEFFIGMWYFPGTTDMASKAINSYPISVQGTLATGADTAWALVVNNVNPAAFSFYASDGATRSLVATFSASVAANTWNYLAVERFNGTCYLSVNGAVGASAAYSATLNIPSGRVIRIGKSEFVAAGTNYPETLFDAVQIKRRAPYGGASFRCPTPPNYSSAIWH